MLQQQSPAVMPASYGYSPARRPNRGSDKCPKHTKHNDHQHPKAERTVRSVMFREQIPIPAISMGRRAFSAKFMEYTHSYQQTHPE